MFQVKIGMRNIVMPGARIVDTVAMMLTAVMMPATPEQGDAHDPEVAAERRASGRRRTAACRRTSRSWRRRLAVRKPPIITMPANSVSQ